MMLMTENLDTFRMIVLTLDLFEFIVHRSTNDLAVVISIRSLLIKQWVSQNGDTNIIFPSTNSRHMTSIAIK